MKILFIARHYSYLRLFESAVVELAARGHEITLAADREETMGGRQMVERIAAAHPNVRLVTAPGRHGGAWSELARHLRLGLDYLRFIEPQYATTRHLRRRAEERAPRLVVRWVHSRLGRLLGGRRAAGAVLRTLERGLPTAREAAAFLRQESPDVVLITPLVDIGSPQLDYLAAARRLGLRTVLPVGSWDHLSSKSLLRSLPDRVIVWNDVQKREAVELHGVPAERVTVTGSQCYDQWFDRRPSRSREAFCAGVGLPADRPFVLYVCSSLFRGTADEPAVVDAWIRAIRSSGDPRVKDIGILIRPHPARLDEWKSIDLSAYRGVAFRGAHPVDQKAKDDYFDSFHYSAAVVGINTSAFIEAAVVGKPVHTVVLPEISADNQEGTLHFHYLLNVNGGLLRVARSFEEHVGLLAGSLAGEGGGDPRAASFVDGFVRPLGRGVAATPRFADAVEQAAAAAPPVAESQGAFAFLAFLVLYPLAALWSLHLRTQPWRTRKKHALRKAYTRRKMEWLRRIKQFASDNMGDIKRPKVSSTQVVGSALSLKAGQRRDPAKTLAGSELPAAKETREVAYVLRRSTKPIILGPWLSETGFELLYWIPFLAWAKAYANLDPDRLIVVSRGGAASWYQHITPHYEDIFSFYTPDEFRAANDRRIAEQEGRQKHLGVSSLDREIIARVQAKRGLRGTELLHPSQMYNLFDNFWFQRVPVTLIEAFSHFSALLPPPDSGVRAHLPARYVAAKFYGNVALPDTPDNQRFVTRYLADLAEHSDVVLLNTGQRFDDHSDFPGSLRGRLHTIEHLMRPENNLAIQTEVIRGADAFVGTYGGFSYLAPLSGVNTIAFYSHPDGFRFDHLEVAKRVFAGLERGTFAEVDLRGVDTLRLGFGGASLATAAGRR